MKSLNKKSPANIAGLTLFVGLLGFEPMKIAFTSILLHDVIIQ